MARNVSRVPSLNGDRGNFAWMRRMDGMLAIPSRRSAHSSVPISETLTNLIPPNHKTPPILLLTFPLDPFRTPVLSCVPQVIVHFPTRFREHTAKSDQHPSR